MLTVGELVALLSQQDQNARVLLKQPDCVSTVNGLGKHGDCVVVGWFAPAPQQD